MAFTLKSDAFQPQGEIPKKHTCDGKDLSPALSWSGAPPETQTFALIVDDPDVPAFLKDKVPDQVWDHWVVFNIPAEITSFPEGLNDCPPGATCGKNSWGRNDYGGPCPPDREHRYFFRLYALDTKLPLPETTDKKALLAAMEGHILAQAQIMGRYTLDKNR